MYEFACLPFGLATVPRVFTKLMKPVVGLSRQLGIRLIVCLFRRHVYNGSIPGHCPPTCLNCSRSFARVGLHDKLSEVTPNALHKDGIFRIRDRLHHTIPRIPSRQNQECKKGVSDLTRLAISNGETTSQVTGPPYLYHSSCLSRAPPLPPLAKREKQGLSTFSNLRLRYYPFFSGQRGIGLVEGQPGSMEWKSSGFGFSMPPDKVGRQSLCISLAKWDSLCRERKLNSVRASVESILEFLTSEFNLGKGYRTLNVYRSAISSTHPKIDSVRVGPTVKGNIQL